MKKKIVLWANDEKENKVLIALELLAEENKVRLYSFAENIATEELYNQLMNDWREDKEIEFPEGHEVTDRPLSMTEELLPDNLKVERSDVIIRAKTEWHFVVLSSKLYDLYSSELEEFKDKVEKLSDYDGNVFEELKGFWSKLSAQAREKNLFREQADQLKNGVNNLFERLKDLRSQANDQFSEISKVNMARFTEQINAIEEKIDKGLGLKPIFDELKELQKAFNDEKFTKGDRSSLWNRIDGAFKKYKEKRYGDKQGDNSGVNNRLERRYQGLLSAIDKMEKSIARDQKDINFQNKRVDATQGQLEMQLRQAKIKMVEERINSKNEKLAEMLATKIELEEKLENESIKREKIEEQRKIKAKAKDLKEKIADEINQKAAELSDEAEKLEEAAKAINETPQKTRKPKKKNLLSDLATEVGEMIEDVTDTVKAVAHVAEEKIEENVKKVKSEIEEIKEEYKIDEKVEQMKKKAEALVEDIEEKVEDLKDKITGEEE